MGSNGIACVGNSMLTVLIIGEQFLENLFIMTAFEVLECPLRIWFVIF